MIGKKSIVLFRIRLLFWLLLIAGGFGCCFLIPDEKVRIVALIPAGIMLLVVFILFLVWPILKYKHLGYEYNEEMIIIRKGVIFQSEIIIPIIQVQDVNTYQGPIMGALKLKGVTISTAGSNKSITGLDEEKATSFIYEIEKSIYYKVKNEKLQ